jgi:hypothetical protein
MLKANELPDAHPYGMGIAKAKDLARKLLSGKKLIHVALSVKTVRRMDKACVVNKYSRAKHIETVLMEYDT